MARLVAVAVVEIASVEIFLAMVIGEIHAHLNWVQRRASVIGGAIVVTACVLGGTDFLLPLSKTGWLGIIGCVLGVVSLAIVYTTVAISAKK